MRPGSAVEKNHDTLFNASTTSSRPQSGKMGGNLGGSSLTRPPSYKQQSYKNVRPISAISRNSRFDQFNHSSAVSLTNINEKSEYKGDDSKLRFEDDQKIFDELYEIEEIFPDTIDNLKTQIEAQRDKNRDIKRRINTNNEENAELEVVLSTCLNELRDSLNICKVTTNNFTNIDVDTKN